MIRWLQIHQVAMGTEMEQFDKGHRSKIRSIIIGPNETPRQEGSSTRKKMGLRSKVSEKRSNFKVKGEQTNGSRQRECYNHHQQQRVRNPPRPPYRCGNEDTG